jgi:Flp pilus assembly protein TadB
MDIIKLSTDWARAEVFSSKIVLLFSVVQILTAIGFWYFGRTAMAKAFFWPMLVCGVFLVAVGAGLYLANNPRIKKFETEGRENPSVFMETEFQRTTKSQGELSLVFKILPSIIIVAAILVMLLGHPHWRAISVTIIATAAFLMVVDSNTEARNDA